MFLFYPSMRELKSIADYTILLEEAEEELSWYLQIGTSDFEEKKKLIKLKPEAGCYELHSNTGKSLYVGRGVNIRNRIREHMKEGVWGDKKPFEIARDQGHEGLTLRVWYVEEPSKHRIRMLEGVLIHVFKPIYNCRTSGIKCMACEGGVLASFDEARRIECLKCDTIWLKREEVE